MPYPIQLVDIAENNRIEAENAKAEKEEDKKPIPHDIINETTPFWKKKILHQSLMMSTSNFLASFTQWMESHFSGYI